MVATAGGLREARAGDHARSNNDEGVPLTQRAKFGGAAPRNWRRMRAGRVAAGVVCAVTVGGTAGVAISTLTPGLAGAATQRGTLFVGNLDSSTITSYAVPTTGNVSPTSTINSTAAPSIDYPYAMTPDAAGDLWVSNYSADSVVEFTPDQLRSTATPTPAVTITSGDISGPVGLTFDASGNLWVTNYTTSTLVRFTAAQIKTSGNLTPGIIISGAQSGLNMPETSAFAANGDLWTANSNSNTLVAFTPSQLTSSGDPTPVMTVSADANKSLDYPFGLAFDASGNLWASNEEGNTLVRFTPGQLAAGGSPTPSVTLTSDPGSIECPWQITFDGAGDLWVANEFSPVGVGSVVEFSPDQLAASGSPTPASTINGTNTGLDAPAGLAFIPPPPNYLLIGSDGGTFAFGAPNFEGSLPGMGVHVTNIVGAVPTIDGKGYLLIGSDGGTFAFGDANFEGSLPGMGVHVNNIVAVVPTADDKGYLMIGSDGGTFTFGDAMNFGSLPGMGVHVNNIVGAVSTIDGKGYLLIGSDGGTFAFGNANFEGSLPGMGVHVNNVVAVVPTVDNNGYLMLGSDGGTFAFGNANFEGSLPGIGVSVSNIVAVIPTWNDKGYTMIGTDGGTFTFGNAVNAGSLPGIGVHVNNIVSGISS